MLQVWHSLSVIAALTFSSLPACSFRHCRLVLFVIAGLTGNPQMPDLVGHDAVRSEA